MGACPGIADLDALCRGTAADEGVRAHVSECSACSARLDGMRANHALLDELVGVASRAPRAAPPPATDAVPGYELLGELGRGGQGVVFRALQRSTRREAAVKILPAPTPRDARRRRRFEREVEIAAALRHPGIVTIYDSGALPDGRMFLAMELVSGLPLDEWLRRRRASADAPPELGATIELFADLCDAVAHAHRHGVIHRDLKPANVLVDAGGRPRVLDFGLALMRDADSEAARLTRTGDFVGTLAYASPEQLRGDPAALDTRTDVFSIGVMLYQALSGRLPHDTSGPLVDAIRNITEAPPPPLARPAGWRGGRTDELEAVVGTALAKDPERRYATAEALGRDLRNVLSGAPLDARRDSRWYVLRKALARNRRAVAAAAAFAALLVLGAGVSTALWLRADALALDAQREAAAARAQQKRALRSAAFLSAALRSPDPLVGARDQSVGQMLDRAATEIDGQFADDPAAAAALHDAVGQSYQGIGRYDAAETHLRRAVELLRSAPDAPPHHLGEALANLAGLLDLAGRPGEAEPICREAILLLCDGPGAEHPCRGARAVLAGALYSLGRLDQAAEALRAVLASPPSDAAERNDVLTRLNNLALIYDEQGQLAQAEQTYRAALELLGDGAGDHPTLGTLLGNLASVLGQRERLAEAEQLYRRALEVERRVWGDEHPNVAGTLNNLSHNLCRQGRAAEAEPLLNEALRIAEAAHGPQHPQVALVLYNLGTARSAQGDDESARALLRRCVAAATAAPSDDTALALALVRRSARWLAAHEALEDAAVAYDAALRAMAERLPEGRGQMIDVLCEAGETALALGRPGRARQDAERALALLREPDAEPPSEAGLAGASLVLGRALIELGVLDAAEAALSAAQRAAQAADDDPVRTERLARAFGDLERRRSDRDARGQ